MAGLLETLFGQPGSDQATSMGLLASGLMSRGGLPQGLLAATQYMAPEAKAQRQMAQLQLQETQQKMADQQRARDFMQNLSGPQMMASQQALAGGGGPTNANAARIPAVNPMSQMLFEGAKAGVVPFDQYVGSLQPKPPIKLGADESLLDPLTYKPLAAGTPKLPAAVQEYQFAKQQGFPGTFEQWQLSQKKAGATNVSVGVSTERSFLSNLGEGFGKGISDAKQSAQSSLGTINTVNRLQDALDSGKVMAGPGATFRQFGLQVGNMLGISGKDANEAMLNTRQAIQSLAQLELDGAQQMKGQGQITEAEREIIRRAASGNIDGMTVPELKLLGGVLDKTARFKIRSYNQQVAPVKNMPNASSLAPFLDVQEPPTRRAPNVMRFDAQGNLITN